MKQAEGEEAHAWAGHWITSGVYFGLSGLVLYFTTRVRQALARERSAKAELSIAVGRLRQAQEIANLGSFVYDLGRNHVASSPQLQSILGLGSNHSETPSPPFMRRWRR